MPTADVGALSRRIRRLLVSELLGIGYGHFGGSLSIVEALAALYGREMTVDPSNPAWEERDRLVLSKGHAAPALYAALAAIGMIPEERLSTLNANGTELPSHADRLKVPGVEMTTGSMGQGISAAAGMAHGLRASGRPNRVYVIVGDGELNEGQCWEAAQFIAHRRLTNLVLLVDDNKKQLDGTTHQICEPFDLVAKFTAFGFDARRVPGQDAEAIADALAEARDATDRPVCLVLDTVKGAGVPYLEQMASNHHVRLDDEGKSVLTSYLADVAQKEEQ
ncbi:MULTISPECIES: transketolase [unclassified Luteococcus]|uniref:transketolase n=1 Tax=unclassified Luteococcus TaxID=2639923 RepID=UPI00313C8F07